MKYLAINRGCIFAAVSQSNGVYMFDQRSKTWLPTGLQEIAVANLVSHQSDLYAGTRECIYEASIPVV